MSPRGFEMGSITPKDGPPVIVTNFEEFLNKSQGNPLIVLLSFNQNGISWEEPGGINLGINHKPVRWPDFIIQHGYGNCVDFALFFHFFASSFGISNSLGFVAFLNRISGERQIGHCFPIFRGVEGAYWVWNYHSPGYGDINGPFETEEDAASECSIYFSVLYNGILQSSSMMMSDHLVPRKTFYSIVRQEELAQFVDGLYGDNIQQSKLLQSLPSLRTFAQMVRRAGQDIKGDVIDMSFDDVIINVSKDFKKSKESLRMKTPLNLIFPSPTENDIRKFYKLLSFGKLKSLIVKEHLTDKMRWWPNAR